MSEECCLDACSLGENDQLLRSNFDGYFANLGEQLRMLLAAAGAQVR